MTRSLQGKTLFITGASRGIGLAIARRAAADGANLVLIAKTTEPNPKLPGTLASAAAEVEAAGGKALAIQTDIRDEANAVASAVAKAVAHFGGIDILINNASAISLTPTHATPMKRFDLMFGVNVRGTYCCTQACLPELIKSAQGRPQPACAEHEPAAVDEGTLVQGPRGLHDGQVRHERVHARPRRRVPPLSASPSTACGRARRSPPRRCR
jgi:citronellol/citronellal dehydrogenase